MSRCIVKVSDPLGRNFWDPGVSGTLSKSLVAVSISSPVTWHNGNRFSHTVMNSVLPALCVLQLNRGFEDTIYYIIYVCMYVCVCVCMCVYVCMYIYIYIYIHDSSGFGDNAPRCWIVHAVGDWYRRNTTRTARTARHSALRSPLPRAMARCTLISSRQTTWRKPRGVGRKKNFDIVLVDYYQTRNKTACHWMHATCQQPRQITHIQLSCLS